MLLPEIGFSNIINYLKQVDVVNPSLEEEVVNGQHLCSWRRVKNIGFVYLDYLMYSLIRHVCVCVLLSNLLA